MKEKRCMKEKQCYVIAIIGAVICFIGDNLLGYFVPANDFGNKLLCINFSYDWADANPYRFVLAGVCGVIALLLMFCGFYGIYLRMQYKGSRYTKYYLVSSFIFVSVGIFYHNVFAISAYIYNKLVNAGFTQAKEITMGMFNIFIVVGGLAALGYVGNAVLMFISATKQEIFQRKWMCIINPIFFMILCVALSKVLPQTSFVNGVFVMGQQSIGLIITFTVLYLTCDIYDNAEA